LKYDPRSKGIKTSSSGLIGRGTYYLQGDHNDLAALLGDLQDVIDERRDDVRAYSVRPLSEAQQIGCPWLPEGVGLFE
jgi:hypothetical protein